MSRLWRDQIQVFLAPERIDLIRSSRGFKPVQAPKVTILCQRGTDQPAWEASCRQLEELLVDATNTELSVTLSNHFVRYVTLPPQSEITEPDEVTAYASFRMREIYAERIDSWVLSVSAWNPATGAICAAIPRALMTCLEEMAVRHKIRLTGIEPYLASAYDRWYSLLNGKRTYFVLIETGRLCIALLTYGIWQSIRNQRFSHGITDELLAALNQEAILSGHKEAVESFYLFSPEYPEITLPAHCGWQIIPLPTEQIPALSHYPSLTRDNAAIRQCIA